MFWLKILCTSGFEVRLSIRNKNKTNLFNNKKRIMEVAPALANEKPDQTEEILPRQTTGTVPNYPASAYRKNLPDQKKITEMYNAEGRGTNKKRDVVTSYNIGRKDRIKSSQKQRYTANPGHYDQQQKNPHGRKFEAPRKTGLSDPVKNFQNYQKMTQGNSILRTNPSRGQFTINSQPSISKSPGRRNHRANSAVSKNNRQPSTVSRSPNNNKHYYTNQQSPGSNPYQEEELQPDVYIEDVKEKREILTKLETDIKSLEIQCKELKTKSFANSKTLVQLEELDARKEEEKLVKDIDFMNRKIKQLIHKIEFIDEQILEKENYQEILNEGKPGDSEDEIDGNIDDSEEDAQVARSNGQLPHGGEGQEIPDEDEQRENMDLDKNLNQETG